jgi:hypothetical protein
MDKITNYQNKIVEVLTDFAAFFSRSSSPITLQMITDTKNYHYMLVWIGWQDNSHIYSVITHLHILNDKIWIQEDRTEVGIANLLVEKGIPKSDIVLAYFTPLHRQYTEFAVS